jgi:hypothetical protein
MAAGLGFKTFTTGEVLTSADTNGYLMQGVLVFASAAARDAAITSPQEGQFAYLKDTNVTTYYTGSAWANLDTTGMTNPMTTTGDTIYSSSGSTPARLGIGTVGQVLTVNSGATAPEWAAAASGSMTLLSTTNLTGTRTTISSISQAYIHLYFVMENCYPSSDTQATLIFNGDTTTSNYVVFAGRAYPTTANVLNESIAITGNGIDNVVGPNQITFTTFNYTNATYHSTLIANAIKTDVPGLGAGLSTHAWNGSAAITSVGIGLTGTATWSAGTIKIYGVK